MRRTDVQLMNWEIEPPKQANPVRVAWAANSSRSDTLLVSGIAQRHYSTNSIVKGGPVPLIFGKQVLKERCYLAELGGKGSHSNRQKYHIFIKPHFLPCLYRAYEFGDNW